MRETGGQPPARVSMPGARAGCAQLSLVRTVSDGDETRSVELGVEALPDALMADTIEDTRPAVSVLTADATASAIARVTSAPICRKQSASSSRETNCAPGSGGSAARGGRTGALPSRTLLSC